MQWRKHSLETVRELIIEHGASINFVERICTIRVNENYPYKDNISVLHLNLKRAIKNYNEILSTFIT